MYDVIIYEKKRVQGRLIQTDISMPFEYMFVLSKGKPKTVNLFKRQEKTTGQDTPPMEK